MKYNIYIRKYGEERVLLHSSENKTEANIYLSRVKAKNPGALAEVSADEKESNVTIVRE